MSGEPVALPETPPKKNKNPQKTTAAKLDHDDAAVSSFSRTFDPHTAVTAAENNYDPGVCVSYSTLCSVKKKDKKK